jgi:hypothetical protein
VTFALVVLDQMRAAGRERRGDGGYLGRSKAERRFDDRADEHLVRRRERRAG